MPISTKLQDSTASTVANIEGLFVIALPGQYEVVEHGHSHVAELRQTRTARRVARHARARDWTQLWLAGNILLTLLSQYISIYLSFSLYYRTE